MSDAAARDAPRPSPLRRLAGTARHPMTQNAVAMYGVQAVTTILPLVTLPWLARALGPAELGRVFLTQSFAALLGILVGYGFLLSGARDIARQRNDPAAMQRTLAGVLAGQILLVGIGTVATVVALVGVGEFRADPSLVAFAWFMGVAQGLNPAWFLLGIEQVRAVAFNEVIMRSLSAVAIVVFVRDPGDGLLVLWIWSIANAFVTLGLTRLVLQRVAIHRASLAEGWRVLRKGWALFIGTASSALTSSGTVFTLGLVVSTVQVALYTSAQRLISAAARATAPIGTVTYPRVNHLVASGREARAQRLSSLTLLATAGIASCSAAFLILLAPWLIDVLFGDEYRAATPILRVLALTLPLHSIAITLSRQWLLPRGHDRRSTSINLAGGALSIVATVVVGSAAGTLAAVWTLVGVQAVVVAALTFAIWREGLLPARAHLIGR